MIVFNYGTTLEAALAYAGLGWYVLPVPKGQKRPSIADWPRQATTDRDKIMGWWADPTVTMGKGEPNVGILCGPKSGIIVLDVDPRNGGEQSLADALAELRGKGLDEPRLKVRTGSGGLHIYCKHGPYYIRSRTGQKGFRDGIEIKGEDNQFVVAPPSVHPNGSRYEWLPIKG